MAKTIKYKDGYKFQLYEPDSVQTLIKPSQHIATSFIGLDPQGVLHIAAGYAWDGASGPAFNTKTIIRGSLYHDACYQLMREGRLDLKWREAADDLMIETCKQDGMWKARRWWVYAAIRSFAARAAEPQEDVVLVAP